MGCPRLLIQYVRSYSPYWRLFLHPQPEDAPCRGDKDPLITWVLMEHRTLIRTTVRRVFHGIIPHGLVLWANMSNAAEICCWCGLVILPPIYEPLTIPYTRKMERFVCLFVCLVDTQRKVLSSIHNTVYTLNGKFLQTVRPKSQDRVPRPATSFWCPSV